MQWTQEQVTVLLGTLNLSIKEIREATLVNPREGLLTASELISIELGNDCTAARVLRKIKHLWETCGRDEGDKEPWELCLYGACSKSLPRLEEAMLKAVNERVNMKLLNLDPPEARSGTGRSQTTQTRRSRRHLHKQPGDPINCRCESMHDHPWLRCNVCSTWQHVYCYYDKEDNGELARDHMCDNCRMSADSSSLQHAVGQLDIHEEEAPDKDISFFPRDQPSVITGAQETRLGPFGTLIERDVTWGPDDDEICDSLQIIRSRILGVANSMVSELDISEQTLGAKNPDTLNLVRAVLDPDDPETWLRPEFVDPTRNQAKRRRLLQAIFAAAVTQWVLTTDNIEDSEDTVLLNCYQEEILSKHELLVLEALHRRAYLRMMQRDSPLEQVHTKRAAKLANRCLAALSPIMTTGTYDSTVPDASELPRRDYLIHAFRVAMRLRKWLPLAQTCFEFFVPTIGLSPPAGTALKLGEEAIEEDEAVHYCLMPGVAEYPLDFFQAVDSGSLPLLNSGMIVIKASDEQRKVGRIICPAVVETNL